LVDDYESATIAIYDASATEGNTMTFEVDTVPRCAGG